MKRLWNQADLEQQWMLSTHEQEWVLAQTKPSNQLGFALLLKWFEIEGRFPKTRNDIPAQAVAFVAKQLQVTPDVLSDYDWEGRVIKRQPCASCRSSQPRRSRL